MKILYVTNEIPYPPDNGVRIVSYNAIRLMHETGHEIALAVLTEETDEPELRFKRIENFCKKGMAWWLPLKKGNIFFVFLKSIILNKLFFVERYKCSMFREKLIRLVDEFQPHVIHFDLITMVQYYDVGQDSIGKVASINDSYSLALENFIASNNYKGIMRFYRMIQYFQSRLYESKLYEKFEVVHVMAKADATYLKRLNHRINTFEIPNGVNPSLFKFQKRDKFKKDIIFVAKLAGANLESLQRFLDVAWPVIRRACPIIKFHIVGSLDADAMQLRSTTEKDKRVIFHGYLKTLDKVYNDCGIAVVPINKNCGIINKVIEAMAAGLVVVGFEKTFCNIKEGKPGVHFVTVSDYQEIGQTVVNLVQDELRCRSIQEAANNLAAKNYSWSDRKALYHEMYLYASDKAARMSHG